MSRRSKRKFFISLLVCFVILFSFQVGIVPSSGNSPFKNPRSYEIEYRVVIKNINAKMQTVRIWIGLPTELDYQKNVVTLGTTPSPTQEYRDKKYGNEIGYWSFQNVHQGSEVNVTLKWSFTRYDIQYDIDPNNVGQYDPKGGLYKNYTEPSEYVQSSDLLIQKKAQDIVGSETNPYWKAQKIYYWIIQNIEYSFTAQQQKAKDVLLEGKGDCGGQSALFCALCMAEGIPARNVAGLWWPRDGTYSSKASLSNVTNWGSHE